MANELFDQLMTRVPDPMTYEGPDVLRLMEEGMKTGEMPINPGNFYKVISELPKMIQASRPAAALYQQLMAFRPEKVNPTALARSSRVGGRYQTALDSIKPPEGFIVPHASKRLPRDPFARSVMQERRILKENQPSARTAMKNLDKLPPPPTVRGGDPIEAAKAALRATVQPERKLTVADQRARGIGSYVAPKGNNASSVLPEFEAYIVDQASKWQGGKTAFQKKVGLSWETLNAILKKHGTTL
jgi:hypothetical protein